MWDALSAEGQELLHAGFAYGRQTRGALPVTPPDSPLAADDALEERKEAARAMLFYRTLLSLRIDEVRATAFTLARIQARGMSRLRIDLPGEESPPY